MSSIFTTLEIASSGMKAQRTRMNVAAMNMANKNTTRSADGGVYQRRDVVLEAVEVDHNGFASRLKTAMQGGPTNLGVKVQAVQKSDDQFRLHYDPGHPDANEEGYVEMPAVSGIEEMVNMMSAARAYEAGAKMMTTVKTMAEQALRIGR
jgi:flagellar basal-body rod protein FlgC